MQIRNVTLLSSSRSTLNTTNQLIINNTVNTSCLSSSCFYLGAQRPRQYWNFLPTSESTSYAGQSPPNTTNQLGFDLNYPRNDE